MSLKPPPQVPASTSSILSGVSESLSFHSSPEAFLVARVIQHNKEHPNNVRERTPVRAKILNRNVIILSSYRHVQEVLNSSAATDDSQPPYVAVPAYRQLMQDFFPPPNLLLQDGQMHNRAKAPWIRCAQSLQSSHLEDDMRRLASEFFDQMPNQSSVDLYEVLKRLSWKLFLSAFLDLPDEKPEFEQVMKLQEDLLRGQFSLFPASVNVGFWHSPRKKGIDARKSLQGIIAKRLCTTKPTWISEDLSSTHSSDEIVNHILMATSSLAVKGFASLMLALLLNMFLFSHERSGSTCLADWVNEQDPKQRARRLDAILKETTRLSPPIVGVLRRTTRECIVSHANSEEPDALLPAGFEAWCYFPGANRDPSIFGDDSDLFNPERYLETGTKPPPPPAVFGIGRKYCLGADFVRKVALVVVEVMLNADIRLTGSVDAVGVRAWLGHQLATPEEWARDVKQLPTQRPARPVLVDFRK